jgi:hypothetical protein
MDINRAMATIAVEVLCNSYEFDSTEILPMLMTHSMPEKDVPGIEIDAWLGFTWADELDILRVDYISNRQNSKFELDERLVIRYRKSGHLVRVNLIPLYLTQEIKTKPTGDIDTELMDGLLGPLEPTGEMLSKPDTWLTFMRAKI